MAVENRRNSRKRAPLDSKALDELALGYVGRYATTRARLGAYLQKKVRERGWSGCAEPAIATIVERLASLGYVDDRAFASDRAAALARRGYGERRVREVLRAAGVEEEDASHAQDSARRGAWQAAARLAERRRIGPFATAEPDRAAREKALAILLRAGHPLELARRLAYARPGEFPATDSV